MLSYCTSCTIHYRKYQQTLASHHNLCSLFNSRNIIIKILDSNFVLSKYYLFVCGNHCLLHYSNKTFNANCDGADGNISLLIYSLIYAVRYQSVKHNIVSFHTRPVVLKTLEVKWVILFSIWF